MDTNATLRNVVSGSVATGVREAGEFCWFNLMTPRPKKAAEFFGALLGWKTAPMPGMRDGLTVSVEGRAVGAIWDQEHPDTPKDCPAVIGVAVKVDSADATAELVRLHGGRVLMGPFDIMDAGRMAACVDPTGAHFDLWQPYKHAGTDVDNRLPGAPSWFEARTPDRARASAFYATVFGWQPDSVSPDGNMRYTTFAQRGRFVAGLVECPGGMNVPPHWATFFNVVDVDAAAEQAAALGAQTHMPPTDIPGIGRFCALASPEGVPFQLIKYARA